MELIGLFLAVIVIAVLLFYNSLSWGFVMYKFWYWFVLPVFAGLPEVTYLQAVGLMFFISLFRSQLSFAIKKEYRDTSTENTLLFMTPWLMLFTGWLIMKIFMG